MGRPEGFQHLTAVIYAGLEANRSLVRFMLDRKSLVTDFKKAQRHAGWHAAKMSPDPIELVSFVQRLF